MHADPGFPMTVGENVTVGHNAMLHGCTIGDELQEVVFKVVVVLLAQHLRYAYFVDKQLIVLQMSLAVKTIASGISGDGHILCDFDFGGHTIQPQIVGYLTIQ